MLLRGTAEGIVHNLLIQMLLSSLLGAPFEKVAAKYSTETNTVS